MNYLQNQITPEYTRINGFTLVELSIVLVIVGILAGAVVTAQELIRNAEIKDVITQTERYKTAIYGFKDKYLDYPGDLPDQDRWWPNECTAANAGGSYPCGGTNDSKIAFVLDGSTRYNENILALNNLVWAEMIEGPVFSINVPTPSAATYAHPVMDSDNIAIYIADPGKQVNVNWYSNFNPNYSSLWIGGREGDLLQGILTPLEAHRIDDKVDDGKPRDGKVHSEHTITGTPSRRNCLNASRTDYNFDYEQRLDGCNMRFSLDF